MDFPLQLSFFIYGVVVKRGLLLSTNNGLATLTSRLEPAKVLPKTLFLFVGWQKVEEFLIPVACRGEVYVTVPGWLLKYEPFHLLYVAVPPFCVYCSGLYIPGGNYHEWLIAITKAANV